MKLSKKDFYSIQIQNDNDAFIFLQNTHWLILQEGKKDKYYICFIENM